MNYSNIEVSKINEYNISEIKIYLKIENLKYFNFFVFNGLFINTVNYIISVFLLKFSIIIYRKISFMISVLFFFVLVLKIFLDIKNINKDINLLIIKNKLNNLKIYFVILFFINLCDLILYYPDFYKIKSFLYEINNNLSEFKYLINNIFFVLLKLIINFVYLIWVNHLVKYLGKNIKF